MTRFDVSEKQAEIQKLESEMMASDFWDDRIKSQNHINQLNRLREVVDRYNDLKDKVEFAEEGLSLLSVDFDAEFKDELETLLVETEKHLSEFSVLVLLNHDYDQKNAILEIHPGAGGTESQDFAEMLYRMYQRWAAKEGYKVEVLHYLDGEEAGIKSVSMKVSGPLAYGYLKAEKGVHRLVRISPFDSSGRRHTSFVSVDVSPEFDDSVEIEIRPEDIQVDTYRSSGAGGQHVNKTDSAVRITHLETGIVTTCQNGRSQIQNREEALKMLKSKLYQRQIEEQQKQMAAIKGDHKRIEWGSQIRSYVAHPYTMVKDHRTGEESSQLNDVLDGDINAFIEAYLKMMVED